MRASKLLISTLKETPADAEIISHKLMLRSGMIRRIASGIYTWLPLGLRILQKLERIIREEMACVGAQEILMPMVQPKDIWQESGRWKNYGNELLRFKDRNKREFCLGPTHEEIITDLVRKEIISYKQLPVNFYQIQTKFRDEMRPRYGVIRSREFIMKDAYSFHINHASLEQTYKLMYDTYTRILKRLSLEFIAVLADPGLIGGEKSHEFHVFANSGEDTIAFSDESNYAANFKKAEALQINKRRSPTEYLRIIKTPIKSIYTLIKNYSIPIEKLVNTFIVHGVNSKFVALLVRGDHILNNIKAEYQSEVASPLKIANEEEVRSVIGSYLSFIGPLGLNIPIIADHSVAMMSDFVAGANIDYNFYLGINWGRDLPLPIVADIRNVVEGDHSPDGKGKILIRNGIEVAHIFQLGKKYSKAMNAIVIDNNGNKKIIYMGCYGMGITRLVAATIEQHHDHDGIIWPINIAPFEVVLIPINTHKYKIVKNIADNLYLKLSIAGIDVLLDDRDISNGIKFSDIDLIGIPHIIIIGGHGLKNNEIEYRCRKNNKPIIILQNKIIDYIRNKLSTNFG
ncbi:Prolyl-tRNA synthetase [Candidatus Johnevansia muelleri]|uniref:Proline--tRNA ligase n=1 Tax=Candidatus Johnevansia muelleri TaxID=1495769 RepID=A0A078KEH9_9GAMM|nr:Prolyl-tRNA synthetase [Candidatus Evansia muelleri]